MAAAKALDLVPDRRKQDLCRRAYQELHYSTHCASIASASVSLTRRTGSISSSASFAALRRRAPATTSYLLSSRSRTRRGARIPCVLKLAAFCVVVHFVAEDAKRRVGRGGPRSEGHI